MMINVWRPDLTDVEYHDGDGLSSSNLKDLLESPAKFAQAEHKDTPALFEGRLAHMAVLEPQHLDDHYVVSGNCSAFKSNGDACTNQGSIRDADDHWFCGIHGKKVDPADDGKHVVTQDLMEKIDCMAQSVKHNAGQWFPDHMLVENSGYYDLDGLLLKIRPDAMFASKEHGNVIVDLKTTQYCNPQTNAIEKAVQNFKYHLSAAFYCDVASELGFPVDKFVWVFVEKSKPYHVAVAQASESTLMLGREMYKRAIDVYLKHKDKPLEEWPGYDCSKPLMIELYN